MSFASFLPKMKRALVAQQFEVVNAPGFETDEKNEKIAHSGMMLYLETVARTYPLVAIKPQLLHGLFCATRVGGADIDVLKQAIADFIRRITDGLATLPTRSRRFQAEGGACILLLVYETAVPDGYAAQAQKICKDVSKPVKDLCPFILDLEKQRGYGTWNVRFRHFMQEPFNVEQFCAAIFREAAEERKFQEMVSAAGNAAVLVGNLTCADAWARVAPAFNDLAGKYRGRVHFLRLDSFTAGWIADKYHIQQYPCLLLFKDKALSIKLENLLDPNMLREQIKAAFLI